MGIKLKIQIEKENDIYEKFVYKLPETGTVSVECHDAVRSQAGNQICNHRRTHAGKSAWSLPLQKKDIGGMICLTKD